MNSQPDYPESDIPADGNPVSPPTPVVYEQVEYHWKYKQIQRGLDGDGPLGESALNELGEEGWELVTAFTHHNSVYYYLKQPVAD